MKNEMYEIEATKSFLGENGPDSMSQSFKVKAQGHEQHCPNSTRLMNLSASGLRKIKELKDDGYSLRVRIAGRLIGVENV